MKQRGIPTKPIMEIKWEHRTYSVNPSKTGKEVNGPKNSRQTENKQQILNVSQTILISGQRKPRPSYIAVYKISKYKDMDSLKVKG